jgi:hypothetical protein
VASEAARSRVAFQRAERYRFESRTTPSGMCSAAAAGEADRSAARRRSLALFNFDISSISFSMNAIGFATSSGTSTPGRMARSRLQSIATPSPPAVADAGANLARSRACFRFLAGRTVPLRHAIASPRLRSAVLVVVVASSSSSVAAPESNLRSASSAAATSASVAATPSTPFQMIFPRGVYGWRRPAATPDAPPAMPFSSNRWTSTGLRLDDGEADASAVAVAGGSSRPSAHRSRMWYAAATPANPAPMTAILRGSGSPGARSTDATDAWLRARRRCLPTTSVEESGLE